MLADFIKVTEMPGMRVSVVEWQMIYLRYHWASQFVSGKQVLEVGCGPGLGLGYLAGKAKRIIGGDRTEESLRYAQKHYGGKVGLLLLDAHSLPFEDSSFDVVLLFEVIYYLSQPDRFLDECRRVLRGGGILLLCLPNKDRPGFRSSLYSTRYFSSVELLALLSQYHFDAELFGAFPVGNEPAYRRIQAALVRSGKKMLDLMPKGEQIKDLLNKHLFGKTLVLNEEIDDGMVENIELVPLPSDSLDFQHKVLYAIAHAK